MAKTYAALMIFKMNPSWFSMDAKQKEVLSREHLGDLSKFTDRVKIDHLAGTGMSKYDLIVQLESKDIEAMDDMMNAFKAGRKSEQGQLVDVIMMEKGLGRI